VINALTIDVEDYFHVSAFEGCVRRSDWDIHPSRVEKNTAAVLDLLDDHGAKGTFFVLGWVAERFPSLVREIKGRGHEVACHGYGHELVYRIGPENFRRDIRRARQLLEDITGGRVNGYRAPSFSITRESAWAIDIIIEEGFLYDSSLFPISHDLYGFRGISPYPHDFRRPSGILKEFPLSTLEIKWLGRSLRLPVAGGGYLRFWPSWFMHWAIRKINTIDGQPAVFYFHPWEMDPGQPRIKAGLKSRLRHYHNLHKTEGRIRRLLSEFRFAPMARVLGLAAEGA
jgi:polysaccharide deacetylase family protein (PEP-CTERM system associated)